MATEKYIPKGGRGVEKVFVTPDEFTKLLNETRFDKGLAYEVTSWGFDPMDDSHLSPLEERRHMWIVWEGQE